MAEEPLYIRNLRALTRADPSFEHLAVLEGELYNNPSDRAAAVMFGSFVEIHLQHLIVSKMRKNLNSKDRKQLFEFDGIIGTFAAKIITAYAFNIIGKISKHDLDLIRLLRNEFAHSRMSFGFQTPVIRAVCDELKVIDLPGSSLPIGYISRDADGNVIANHDLKDPKTRFIGSCHSLSYRMILVREGHPGEGHPVFPNDDPLP